MTLRSLVRFMVDARLALRLPNGPNLIIMFELTMLGAILATVATLAVSARLGPSSKLYDREVSDGKILVGVENPPETKAGDLEAALSAAPGAPIKTI